MPSIPDEFVPWRPGLFTPPRPPEPEAAGLGETVGSAFRLFNWPYRSWRYLAARDGADFDPDHDPFAMIRGTKYETDPERFAFSRDEQETRAIMAEWDQDEADADVMARSGWTGTVAGVGAGLLDPTLLMPVAKVFSGAATGARMLRLAGDVALASGVSAAIGESAMAVTTPHYTAGEFARNVGSATVLGGLLGAGASVLLRPAERQALAEALHAGRVEWGDDIAAQTATPAPAAQAAGAAASDTRRLELDRPAFLDKVPDPLGKVSPTRRVLNAPFISGRRALVDLAETPYIFKENAEGKATTQGPALDRLAKLEYARARYLMGRQFDSAYSRYRYGKEAAPLSMERVRQLATRAMDHTGRARDKMSFTEFRDAVDEALRSGDRHDIPEVAETARWLRENVFSPWRDRAVKLGMLPEGVDAATADSYMMRVWNKQRLVGERPRAVKVFADWLEGEEAKKAGLQDTLRGLTAESDVAGARLAELQARRNKRLGRDAPAIDAEMAELEAAQAARRTRIEEAVAAWEGKSARAAQRALTEKPAEGASAAVDQAVDTAVKRILSKERLRDRKELEALANEIVDRIVGGPDGRLPYDAHTAPWTAAANPDARGPLAPRDFMIPDMLVRDFLDTDAMHVSDVYLRTMVPDVLLTERFGDVRMTEALRKIDEEAAAMQMAAASPQARARIQKQKDMVVEALAGIRDRIRHTYGWSSGTAQRNLGRVAATAARYDMTTNLGGAMLASLADVAGIHWQYGMMSAFRHAWAPFVKALVKPELRAALGRARDQARTLGLAAETYLGTRASAISDVLDVYRPTSRLERGVNVAAEKFGLLSFLTQWTDFAQFAGAMVSSAEMTKAVKALAAGGAAKRQVRKLAEAGIDAAMAERIAGEMAAPGGLDIVEGIMIPNTGAWTDRAARDAFEGAIKRDVDMMVIMPGEEKPLWMSRPVGALIMQYKTFVAAAHERLLVRSLYARDRQVLSGMASAIGLGMLAEYANTAAAGRDMPKEPADWVKAGIIRAGLLGWYGEANAISSKWSSGRLDAFRAIGASRPDSRYISRSNLGSLLGPTANKFENLARAGVDLATLNWNEADSRNMRRLLFGQNLFYVRRALDKLLGQDTGGRPQ